MYKMNNLKNGFTQYQTATERYGQGINIPQDKYSAFLRKCLWLLPLVLLLVEFVTF